MNHTWLPSQTGPTVLMAMLVMHGAAWLAFKADGVVGERAAVIGPKAALIAALLFALGGVFIFLGWFGGYEVTSPIVWDGPSNPLRKTVVANAGAWLHNFQTTPLLWLVPLLGVLLPLFVAAGFRARKAGLTFFASQLSIVCIIATVGLAMFPIILPSSTNPSHSLAVFDASSSRATLRNMLFATAIFLPLILLYTAWVYRVLWGKVSEKDIHDADHAY